MQYCKKLEDNLEISKDLSKRKRDNLDIEDRWCNIRDIIRYSAEETLGKQKIVPRKKWINEGTTDLMLERRTLRNKTDQNSIEKYKVLTNKITQECRKNKARYISDTCKDIEFFMSRGYTDIAYNLIKSLDKVPKRKSSIIQDENGDILTDNKLIVERWKRYIEHLYNGQGLDDEDIENESDVDTDMKGPEIIREEFDKALEEIRNGKAAGNDKIFIELIKAANSNMKNDIFNLIKDMYDQGVVPLDFKTTKTIAIPKKHNTIKCEEHRTLSLISQASKILLKIIQNRIRNATESQLGNDQFGFRRHKGTREGIFALRTVVQRRVDLDLNTYIAFIDLEKAFDKVNWKMMMSTLKQTGIDYRDRKIIYELYRHQETLIEINNNKETAKIRQGVRQGCSLSPLIFNIFIEAAVRKILEETQIGVSVNGNRITFIRYADDIAALANNAKDLEKLLNVMNRVFNSFNMKININKTKILVSSKFPCKILNPINIDNSPIEQVNQFKYLGSIITEDTRSTTDIKTRIAIAKQTFQRKRTLFTSQINKNLRKTLIKTYIWSIALYACETWTLTKRDRERLEAFEMWCWRRLEKISWTEKVTNEEVLCRVKEKRQILNHIEKRRGNMVGHLIRHDSFITNILEGQIEARRKRGRPRRKYTDQLKEMARVETYKEMKEMALDRDKWRQMLHRQVPGT